MFKNLEFRRFHPLPILAAAAMVLYIMVSPHRFGFLGMLFFVGFAYCLGLIVLRVLAGNRKVKL